MHSNQKLNYIIEEKAFRVEIETNLALRTARNAIIAFLFPFF